MKKLTAQSILVPLVVIVLGIGRVDAAEALPIRVTLQSVQDRKPAPTFGLENIVGNAVRLSDYRGKVVLLDFWATQCDGCIQEIPSFMDLAQAYKKKGLAVVGVSVDVIYENLKDSREGWNKVRPFVQTHKVNYPILMADDQVIKSYGIQALPLTYIVNKRGRIAAVYHGPVDKENLETNIKIALKE